LFNLKFVEHVRAYVTGLALRTPVVPSEWLSDAYKSQVSLKCENLQHTGSFKARGALSVMRSLTPAQLKKGVTAVSGGNHAQAVAWAARELGVDCVVEMWETASAFKVERTRGFGATVDLSSPDPSAAYDRALELVSSDAERRFLERRLRDVQPPPA